VVQVKRFATHRDDADGKDAVILPILSSVRVADPSTFKAILMPALHGPEVDILLTKGVPLGNMWAIERDPETRRKIKDRGLRVASGALEIKVSINEMLFIDPGPYGLVYLDPFGKPSLDHFDALVTLMDYVEGTLIYNCCPGARCPAPLQRRFTAALEDFSEGRDVDPVSAMILCAAMEAGTKVEDVKTQRYMSKTGNRELEFHTCSCRVVGG
jgi:hypothetical protein